MADESLKSYFREIEAREDEMARYRARFARRLPKPGRMRLWIPMSVTTLATAALTWFLLVPNVRFPQTTLEELRELASTCSRDTLERAGYLSSSGNGLDRWNALMLLCLKEPPDRGIYLAARGVQEDPRPDFRSYYLEYLLDNADEHRYNCGLLEDLMDRESDRLCLQLYKQLFHIACHHAD